MPEYTPTTEEVRTTYAVALFAREHGPDEHVHDSVSDGDAEFDRWLEQVKADAAAQALEEAADEIEIRLTVATTPQGVVSVLKEGTTETAREWLRARAATYRKEQTDA